MIRFAALFLLLATTASAQPVSLFGEIRHRTEVDDRDLARAEDPATVHLLRTRLGVEARPTPRVRAVVQIQDSRFFGGENPALALGTLDGDADQLDLHQAFFEVDSLGGAPVALRVGRQELAYSNQRLVGSVGWSNVGRSFDAARLRWTGEAASVDLFAAALVTAAGEREPQALVGVVGVWTPAEGHALEATALLDRDATEVSAGPDLGEPRRQRATAGLRAHGQVGPVAYDAEVYGQTGAMASTADAPRDDVRAWLASLEGSADAGLATVALGATRLSGDDDPTDGTDRRFDTLFATNHAFYGAMDYFPGLSGIAGLTDLYLRVSASPAPDWRLGATIHAFSTASGEARALGRELDLSATVMASQGVRVGAGVSVFSASDPLGGETTAWGFLTSSVAF